MDQLAKQSPSFARAKHLVPVNVATLLRELQTKTSAERAIAIALDVEEALHIAADPRHVMSRITHLLDETIAASPSGAHIVLRCSSEPSGVVIEIEREATPRTDRAGEIKVAMTFPA
jgi:signal transduction histidine kinase